MDLLDKCRSALVGASCVDVLACRDLYQLERLRRECTEALVNLNLWQLTVEKTHETKTVDDAGCSTCADVVVPALTEADNNVPSPRRIRLVDLSDNSCRWPIGDPRDPDFSFCGEPKRDGGPYCAAHAALAFEASRR
jgi:hypothetical protein